MHEIAAPPFTYSVLADDELRHLPKTVPPLFIQPYVENAIVHGLKHAEGDNLSLVIEYQKSGTALLVTVTDNGTGFSTKMIRSQQIMDGQIHLGLSVTDKRIQVFAEKNGYDATVTFTTPNPGTPQPGTQVKVVIDKFFV
jgi:sensor histidine kinase YesM